MCATEVRYSAPPCGRASACKSPLLSEYREQCHGILGDAFLSWRDDSRFTSHIVLADLFARPRPMKFGITYTLKDSRLKADGLPDDWQEELDSPVTIDALAKVLEGMGHTVVRLGDGPG